MQKIIPNNYNTRETIFLKLFEHKSHAQRHNFPNDKYFYDFLIKFLLMIEKILELATISSLGLRKIEKNN